LTRPSPVVLQANRYFSRIVRGKAALAVREMAWQVYGRMANDCRDKSTTFESLKAGEVLSPTDTFASCCETKWQCIFRNPMAHVAS